MKKFPDLLLLLLLGLVQFTNVMDFMIMMPLNPKLSLVFHMTPAMFSIVVASYAIAAAVSGIAASFFLDKFDRKRALLFTYFGFIIGTYFCSVAPNYSLMVAARIFTGLFGGIMGAQVLAIVSDVVPYERRGRAMGIIMSAFSVASIAGVPFGLYLANTYNWHTPFIMICAIGIFVWLLSYFVIPPINKHLQEKKDKLSIFKIVRQNKNQQAAIAMMVIMMIGHFMIVPNIADYLVANAGVKQTALFWVYTVGGSITLLTNPLIGILADKRGKKPVFILFILLTFIPVVLLTNLGIVPMWHVLIVTGMLFAFSSGRFGPAQALISETVTPSHRGGFMSLISALQQFGSASGALLAGAILTKPEAGRIEHYNIVGYVCIAITLCSLFFVHKITPASPVHSTTK